MNYSTEKEVWKDIEGYEGLYQVSNLGRVKRLARKALYKDGHIANYKDRILRPRKNSSGYFRVALTNMGIKKDFYIHRLVGLHFLSKPKGEWEINHIDERPINNSVDNLEWCDRKYNMNYGSRAKRTGEKMRKKVVRIDLEDGNKKEYPSVFSTGEDGYNPKRVADVARGDSKTHKGYHWKYI